MFVLDIGQTTTHHSGALSSRRLWFLSYGVGTEYRPSFRSLPPHFCAVAGRMDLLQAFGCVPTNLYLCAAAYVTTNGGPLVAACPADSGPDIGTNGFFVVPVAALRDSLGNGTFDLLDPARGFKILSVNAQNTNCVFNCAVMPGRAYQVQFVNQPGETWNNLAGGSNYTMPPAMILSFTDAPPTGTPQRFYRVELLP
jgi:hypothetical protein